MLQFLKVTIASTRRYSGANVATYICVETVPPTLGSWFLLWMDHNSFGFLNRSPEPEHFLAFGQPGSAPKTREQSFPLPSLQRQSPADRCWYRPILPPGGSTVRQWWYLNRGCRGVQRPRWYTVVDSFISSMSTLSIQPHYNFYYQFTCIINQDTRCG